MKAHRFCLYHTEPVWPTPAGYPSPPGVHPGQYKAGTNIELSDGVVVRVVGQSTQMLLVRPLPWWERLLRRLTHRGTS